VLQKGVRDSLSRKIRGTPKSNTSKNNQREAPKFFLMLENEGIIAKTYDFLKYMIPQLDKLLRNRKLPSGIAWL